MKKDGGGRGAGMEGVRMVGGPGCREWMDGGNERMERMDGGWEGGWKMNGWNRRVSGMVKEVGGGQGEPGDREVTERGCRRRE